MVHQAIHIPDIAPNDVILVNNIPRFLTENGNDLTHSLLVIPTADDTSAPYVSPLSVRGVTLTFRTRQSPIEAYGTLLMLRSRAKISRGTPMTTFSPTRKLPHEIPVGNRGPNRSTATVQATTMLGFQHVIRSETGDRISTATIQATTILGF
ncbi:hypothetical protein MHU86_1102 [Fragilaria crotonensis]|nr:hypothetical protein MHU86_1102 [Fragilaria crotonensis]